jgi:diguanylate cyclase (GGDEF)-like protein
VILHANAAFESLTGYAMEELRGNRPNVFKSGLQGRGFYRGMWSRLGRTGRWQGDLWNRRKDGQLFQDCLTIVALRAADGRAACYLGTYSGFAAPDAVRGRLARPGATDAVTGLLNRHAFVQAVDRTSDQHGVAHVLALDIDGFTEFNELYGLAAGDAILRQMGLRCTEVAAGSTRSAVVARVGPDEFAIGVIAPFGQGAPAATAKWLHELARKLYEAMTRQFDAGNALKLHVSVSIGLASLIRGGDTAAEALLHASAARQQAVPGAAKLECYETQDAQRRLAQALVDAIRQDQIGVVYQPKVDLKSGDLAGVEALARWTLPDGTSVPPSEFIVLAERRGLIGLLGDRVLERVLTQLSEWKATGLPQPVVAVNFSALQFHRDNPAQFLASALDRHQVPPDLIELELTESLLIGEMEGVMQSLRAFRDLGLKLSIDDFGTGYSSLAYLRRFPIHYLKIDRQFVSAMTGDASAGEIVRLIVEMAHRLGLRCIAEGIETIAQLRMLQAMGCDEGQGYLLARPMHRDALACILGREMPWSPLFLEQVPTQDIDADQAALTLPAGHSTREEMANDGTTLRNMKEVATCAIG